MSLQMIVVFVDTLPSHYLQTRVTRWVNELVVRPEVNHGDGYGFLVVVSMEGCCLVKFAISIVHRPL